MASGSMIGASIQFYNDNQYVFAQTNQSPEADDQDVSVDANDNVKITLKGNDDKNVESNNAVASVEVTENNETNQAPQAFDQVTNEANLSDYRYAVWSAGEEEDRYIFFSRSTDGGNTFSTPLSLSGKVVQKYSTLKCHHRVTSYM